MKISRDTSSVQYGNDDLVTALGRRLCNRLLRVGDADRQANAVFGARKPRQGALRHQWRSGRDVGRRWLRHRSRSPATCSTTVSWKFERTMEWLARTYVHAMNCIHYMHDKYFYERLEMALHDRDPLRTCVRACRTVGGG